MVNPTTEEPVAAVPISTRQQLDGAVDAACRAFPAWSATPIEKRQEMLSKLADLVTEHQSQFAELLVKEGGKVKAFAYVSTRD